MAPAFIIRLFLKWQLLAQLPLIRSRLRPERILVLLHAHLVFEDIGPLLLLDVLSYRRIIQSDGTYIVSPLPKSACSQTYTSDSHAD